MLIMHEVTVSIDPVIGNYAGSVVGPDYTGQRSRPEPVVSLAEAASREPADSTRRERYAIVAGDGDGHSGEQP